MANALERRLAKLEERMTNIEQRLSAPNGGLRATNHGRPLENSVRHDNALAATADDEGAMVHRAEQLFDGLLTANPPKLISYSEAYRRIIGQYSVWRNAVHAPAVIQLARQTSSRRVGPLTIRLDALIVGKETRRPAGGHFATAAYSESDWIQTFGTWSLLA
jgi:hypothetical protein